MKNACRTDYETYKEIMGELLSPIMAGDLDHDTLKRLYESKAVYLENLRTKCFWEMNTQKSSHFTHGDYLLILQAIEDTRGQLRRVILGSLSTKLSLRRVS